MSLYIWIYQKPLTLNHCKLLDKLSHYGIESNAVKRFSSLWSRFNHKTPCHMGQRVPAHPHLPPISHHLQRKSLQFVCQERHVSCKRNLGPQHYLICIACNAMTDLWSIRWMGGVITNGQVSPQRNDRSMIHPLDGRCHNQWPGQPATQWPIYDPSAGWAVSSPMARSARNAMTDLWSIRWMGGVITNGQVSSQGNDRSMIHPLDGRCHHQWPGQLARQWPIYDPSAGWAVSSPMARSARKAMTDLWSIRWMGGVITNGQVTSQDLLGMQLDDPFSP